MNIDHADTPLPPYRPRHLVSTGREWAADLRAACAVHESGLVIGFTRLPSPSAPPAVGSDTTSLGMCWAPGGYPVWTLDADSAALRDTLSAFDVAGDAATALLDRLAQEAGAAWVHAWQRERGTRTPRHSVRIAGQSEELQPVG